MIKKIRKAAVIGSGVMGAGIAAHLANVGIQTYLLDMVPSSDEQNDRASRNKLAQSAKDRMVKTTPPPLYSKDHLDLITAGNIEDDLHLLSDVDWVVEVIVENLEAKKELYQKLEAVWKPGTIVSTNTSGLSIQAMVEERSTAFRRHFLGTHFFNPPRYMKLVEIIPGEETDPQVVSYMQAFCERELGKGVVLAKDTPNFIANRIGVYSLIATIHEMLKMEMSIEEVDALTGSGLGRPNSATFRTLDLVGLDTFVHVANNMVQQIKDPSEQAMFEVPSFMEQMVQQRMIGDKMGRGFYQKVKSEKGKETRVLDYRLMEYQSASKPTFASLELAKSAKSLQDKLCTLLYADDKAGEFAWNITKKTLLYSANKIPEIADDIVAIDQAMRWGFNWQMGPFELWDAIGVEKSVARMKEEGEEIPAFVQKLLASGKTSFYEKNQGCAFYFSMEGRIHLARLKEQNQIILQNEAATLVDIGDEVACLEFHSPNNSITAEIVQMLQASLDQVVQNYRGLVLGNQGKNFSVGANLKLLLQESQVKNWTYIEQFVRDFQQISMAMKYFDKPIVAAPFGMTLGGGLEVCFHATRIQALGETYMGLVETGVGLIPAGGGCKEVLLRNMEGWGEERNIDMQPAVTRVFEAIAMGKVSTSAAEAQSWGLLRNADPISISKDYLLYDAKQAVIALSQTGFKPRRAKKFRVVGEAGQAVLKLWIYQMKCSGYLSEHDEMIGKKLAYVLSGGDLPAGSLVDEQYLLDLEREAFLSLCGEIKTQERMQYMLAKGKPLRN